MVRAERLQTDVLAAVVCTALAVGIGLFSDTALSRSLAGPLAALALFLLFLWDIRILVPLLIVALPFGPALSLSFGNLYLSTVLLVVAFVAWIARAVALPQGFHFRYNGILLAVTALVGSFVLSSFQSIAYLLSDSSLIMKFVQFILYSGIFMLVYQMDFSRSAIKHLFVLTLVVGALEGCVGTLQWASGSGLYSIGTLGGHNVFSSYMALMTLLMAGVVLETRYSAVRLAGIAVIAVMVYSIVFSFSRTAYISLLASFLTFGIMPLSKRKRIAIPAAAAALTAVTLTILPVSVLERMRGILHTATGEQIALSFRFRLEMWRGALSDFLASPLIGKGTSATALRDNFFVKAMGEAGLLGLVSFLVLIYLVLRASWRTVADPPRDDFMRGIMVGFFPAAVGSLIVFNLAGDFITINRFIGAFWIALALILRYHEAGQGRGTAA